MTVSAARASKRRTGPEVVRSGQTLPPRTFFLHPAPRVPTDGRAFLHRMVLRTRVWWAPWRFRDESHDVWVTCEEARRVVDRLGAKASASCAPAGE